MQRNKVSMSSVEAAALVLSEGKTTDPEQAELYASGKILDPEQLEKAYYRRALGFDFTISHDEKANKWVVRDDELNITVRTPFSDDEAISAQRLANACMKLKKKHDGALEYQDNAD